MNQRCVMCASVLACAVYLTETALENIGVLLWRRCNVWKVYVRVSKLLGSCSRRGFTGL